MIRSLKLLNYSENLYNVFIEKETLYINFFGKTKVISENVLDYCLEYFNKSLWISFYNEKYLINLVEVMLQGNENIIINKHLVLDIQKYVNKIDSLNMIIKNEKQINLIFRGWNNDKTFIFNSNVSIENNFNIISDNTLNSKIRPFSIYSEDEKAMVLISEKNQCEEYVLYNLLENTAEDNFLLPNTSNASIIKYENRPVLFYNKEINSNVYLKYRYLDIKGKIKDIKEEQSLENIPDNIIDPSISVYMGIIYLVWKNNKYIMNAKSSDLSNWNINYSGKNINSMNVNIIKVIDNKAQKMNTYIKRNIVYNLIKNRESYKLRENNYKLLELLFYENNLNNKIDNINNMIKIQELYSNRCEEYLIKIRELNNIINEKDRTIYNLLNQR